MRSSPLGALLALPLLVALALFASRAPEAVAVEPGLNCDTYAEGVCVVEIGDIWFCESAFQNGACPSSILVGETVRWQNNSSVAHTSTECGDYCPNPASSLWDSGSIALGGTFDLTFDDAGIFNYYCEVHPAMRGIIRVLEEGDVLGDVDWAARSRRSTPHSSSSSGPRCSTRCPARKTQTRAVTARRTAWTPR